MRETAPGGGSVASFFGHAQLGAGGVGRIRNGKTDVRIRQTEAATTRWGLPPGMPPVVDVERQSQAQM